ncbi:DUF29 domain-containing protein [Trichothermofontia sp.]
MKSSSLYESDFYTWSLQQAQLLRDQQYHQVDWEHLIAEVEDLGRSEYRAFVSAIEQLTLYLLKWQFQPSRRSRSWKHSVDKQRIQLERILDDNPGLQVHLDEMIEKGYKYGRKGAIKETTLPETTFPLRCPYAWADLINDDFFPD